LLILAVSGVVCFADVNEDMFMAAQRGDVEIGDSALFIC